MQYYTFPISVEAHSEAEALAKLNLLLAVGSVFVDFKVGNLAGAFIKSRLLECAGKVAEQKKQQKTKPSTLVEVFKKFGKPRDK